VSILSVTARYRKLTREEGYLTKLSALLPAEMVAGYTAINAIIIKASDLTPEQTVTWLWLIFGAFTIFTIGYLYQKNRKLPDNEKMSLLQIVLTTGSFIVWSLAIGEVLTTAYPNFWKESMVNVIVGLWTFGVPLILPSE
jgi:hypothetical protein